LLRPENPVERSRHPNSPFDKLRANWWVISRAPARSSGWWSAGRSRGSTLR